MSVRILPLAMVMGFSASVAFAQQSVRTAQPLPYLRGMDATLEQAARPVSPSSSPENTIIFQEDFSTGASSWTNLGFLGLNSGSTPDTTGVWEYRGPATTPDTGTGSRGAYGTANLTVQSSSPANGFMVFDSDWLDNDGVQGAFGQGIFPAPHRGMLISPSFDASQYPFLNLEFYQYYRRFAGPTSQAQPATYVLFSNNGGATWGDTLTLNSGIAVNTATARNSLIRVNVSNYIGGAANAKIAFLFHGDYYFWQIDDVKITQAPNHDLALVQSIFLPDTTNGRFQEYGMVPAPNTGGVVFQALVRNAGTSAQTNVTLTVNATRTSGGAPLYTGTGSIPSLAPGAEQVVSLNTIFPATTIANMNVTFNVTADSTDAYTLNNSATRQFAITDSSFSPSVIAPVSQAFSGTGQWGSPAAEQVSLGNLFEILTADTVTSATAYLQTGTTGTQAGSSVVFTVRTSDADGLPGDLNTVLFESDVYTVTSQDIARGFIVVPFPANLFGQAQDRVLEPGRYWLVAEMFSNYGANRIRFLDDVTFTMPWFVSVLYTDQWYNNGNAMRMFLNFGTATLASSLPTVITASAYAINAAGATTGGDVTSDGGAAVTARGVAYGTAQNPTTANSTTSDGTGTGSFTSTLTGLTASTLYYVRAYATNSVGTAYGNEVSFTTLAPPQPCPGAPSITDIDGNTYNTVQIGTQCWTQSNLKVSKYRNGDNISNITDDTAWSQTSVGAWSYFMNDASNNTVYAKLYNWYAVADSRGLCPTGWHVPTTSEFDRLIQTAGGYTNAINVLKSQSGWYNNDNGSDSLGFGSTPAGWRSYSGSFNCLLGCAEYWMNSERSSSNSYFAELFHIGNQVNLLWGAKNYGFSVRCIQDCPAGSSSLPTVNTAIVTQITDVSAECGGEVLSDGGCGLQERGVVGSTLSLPNLTNHQFYYWNGGDVGTYSISLSNLSASTTYYVRAYATNSVGTAYGNEVSFTTLAPIVSPTLTTTAVISITATGATSGGNISTDGGASVTERGVAYGLFTNPEFYPGGQILLNVTAPSSISGSYNFGSAIGWGFNYENTQVQAPIVLGTSSNVGGDSLACDTMLINASAVAGKICVLYRGSCEFGVKALAAQRAGAVGCIIINHSAGVMDMTPAGVGSNINIPVMMISDSDGALIRQSIENGDSVIVFMGNRDKATSDGTGTGAFTSTLSGLTASTLYYVRAYATNFVGTAYGNEENFTTLSPTLPSVQTTQAISVSSMSAVVGGDVVQNGGVAVMARGIAYGTQQNPSIVQNFTSEGSGMGAFSSTLMGLSPATTYFARAYATNSVGTAYGNEVTFTTLFNEVTVGTGTGTNSVTSYPAPYGTWYWGARHQFLIRASELSSLGLTSTPIRSLAFDVVQAEPQPLNDFSIKLGHTTATELNSWQVGLSTVYTQTHVATAGWNAHNFDVPFLWNGVDHLVVEICFQNSFYTFNSQTRNSNAGFLASRVYRADNGGVCQNTSLSLTSFDRPNMRLGYGNMANLINGSISYLNRFATPMNESQVQLLSGNTVLGTATTDAQGLFSFSGLASGEPYHFGVSTQKPWGGVNATDAFFVNQHFSGRAPLMGLFHRAADVNLSSVVNATDALQILSRYAAQGNSFALGDWVFSDTTVILQNDTVAVHLRALTAGDANGSYVPLPGLRHAAGVLLQHSGSFDEPDGAWPIKVGEDLEVAAISLDLLLPDGLRVRNIRVPSAAEGSSPVVFEQHDRVLRLAWFGSRPVKLRTGDDLLLLETENPHLNTALSAQWLALADCELADGMGIPHTMPKLLVPVLSSSGRTGWSLMCYPNPFGDESRLSIQLPRPGTISYQISDASGRRVYSSPQELFSAGAHTFDLPVSLLSAGVYQCSVVYDSGGMPERRQLRLVKSG